MVSGEGSVDARIPASASAAAHLAPRSPCVAIASLIARSTAPPIKTSGATLKNSRNARAHAVTKHPRVAISAPLHFGHGAPDMSPPAPYKFSAACVSASAREVAGRPPPWPPWSPPPKPST
jgi:hypothetical protein